MIYDLHVHVMGNSAANCRNYLSPDFGRSLALRLIARSFGITHADLKHKDFYDLIEKRTLSWLDESQADRAVLLALDGAYAADGQFDPKRTHIMVDNEYVSDLASRHPKALWGASIHPYRNDAIQELQKAIRQGACLVKWLPGAQNIAPDDQKCFEFYEALAEYKLPLLSHTGCEHTLKSFPDSLNDPKRLEIALKKGVTVIAAHCGSRLYLHEKDHFRQWCTMAKEYENFYGDISAFAVITRTRPLHTILQDHTLTSKVFFGSDFPARPCIISLLGQLGFRQVRQLKQIQNPFDQTIGTIKALGVPDTVFENAGTILNMNNESTGKKKP